MHAPGSNSVWEDPSTPRVLSDGTPLNWVQGTFSSGLAADASSSSSLALALSLCFSLSLRYPSCPACLACLLSVLLSRLLAKPKHPWPAQGPGVSQHAWRVRTGASQPASVGFVASEKDEGPAGVLVRAKRGQKVSSRLARAWPRDTHSHTQHGMRSAPAVRLHPHPTVK